VIAAGLVATVTTAQTANTSGIAVSPDGTRAYVVNTEGTVSVINTATNQIVATITVGTGPGGVAVTPDGTRVYVTNTNPSVSVISTATNTVISTITTSVGAGKSAPNDVKTSLKAGITKIMMTVMTMNETTNTATGYISADLILFLIAIVFS
jgi:YVTN family beta-propeller protein